MLTPEQRAERDQHIAVVDRARGAIGELEVEAGAACIAIHAAELWRDTFASFEDFLHAHCGSRSTGYRWMQAAQVSATFPDESWLRERPSIAAELAKLRDRPELLAGVVQLVKTDTYRTVKRFVHEAQGDEILLNQVAADPDFGLDLRVVYERSVGAMKDRADQRDREEHPLSRPRDDIRRSIIKIRDGRDHLQKAVELAGSSLPNDAECEKALRAIGQAAFALRDLRARYARRRRNQTESDDE